MEKDITLLGYLMERCLNGMVAVLDKNLNKNGIDLPHSQYVVMRALYQQDKISQSKLADLLQKDIAAIKRTIDKLEEKGLVKRHAVSGRQYNIHITAKGKRMKEAIIGVGQQTLQTLLTDIPHETQMTVLDFFESINQATAKMKNDDIEKQDTL